MFYSGGFCIRKKFYSKTVIFLLHRCVQKWLFAKYCPHFSFITLVLGHLAKRELVNISVDLI